MARLTVALAFAAFTACAASSDGVCANGACEEVDLAADESSLLSLHSRLQGNASQSPNRICTNRFGNSFPCGNGECCGDVCMAPGNRCCSNDHGSSFVCGEGSTCCGNTCAAPGNECCTGPTGYKYPMVTCSSNGGSEPTPSPKKCINPEGVEFFCGSDSGCCGGMCTLPGGVCCTSDFGSQFTCASGSQCCGGGCQAPGSKCCNSDGQKFPLPASLPCPGETPTSQVCVNGQGTQFFCAEGDSCCGGLCAAVGSSCCVNSLGDNFVCVEGTRCNGNVCAVI